MRPSRVLRLWGEASGGRLGAAEQSEASVLAGPHWQTKPGPTPATPHLDSRKRTASASNLATNAAMQFPCRTAALHVGCKSAFQSMDIPRTCACIQNLASRSCASVTCLRTAQLLETGQNRAAPRRSREARYHGASMGGLRSYVLSGALLHAVLGPCVSSLRLGLALRSALSQDWLELHEEARRPELQVAICKTHELASGSQGPHNHSLAAGVPIDLAHLYEVQSNANRIQSNFIQSGHSLVKMSYHV